MHYAARGRRRSDRGQALQHGRPDVGLVHHIDHAGAGDPQDVAKFDQRQGHHGQHQHLEIAEGQVVAGKMVAPGRALSQEAKIRIRNTPMANSGVAVVTRPRIDRKRSEKAAFVQSGDQTQQQRQWHDNAEGDRRQQQGVA